MDNKTIGTRRHSGVSERIERRLRVLIVDADAALDRYRHRHRGLHGGDAFADQQRLGHQTRAEAAVAHAIGRTAHVKIDLVEAQIGANARRCRERIGIAPAELDRDGMLASGASLP